MNGFIARSLTALCGAAALTAGPGCYGYNDLVDPCYPERYEHASRQETIGHIAPQVQNGHVLEQTVWNYHFEPESDKLTAGGVQHLAYLARRRPCPDPVIYLQTAQDLPYDSAKPDELAQKRVDLDQKRVQAIQEYLRVQTAGRPVAFQVVTHDPPVPGISAVPANIAVQQMYGSAQGRLTGGASASVLGGAGAFGVGTVGPTAAPVGFGR
jgi:hypothetical protein